MPRISPETYKIFVDEQVPHGLYVGCLTLQYVAKLSESIKCVSYLVGEHPDSLLNANDIYPHPTFCTDAYIES